MNRRDKTSPYFLDFNEMQSLLCESTVDFPQAELDRDLWDKTSKGYQLKNDVKALILRTVNRNPVIPYLANKAQDIRIIGSLCTNLYKDDSDIDVHIVLDPKFAESVEDVEEMQKQVKAWSHDEPQYIGDHPIELYIQENPAQDLLSDGAYSITQNKWLRGPAILDEEYNPYEVYGHVMDKVRELAGGADVDLGELRRDVVDYKVIKDAYHKLGDQQKQELKSFLQEKLQEIDSDIDELLKDKKEWTTMRKNASKPISAEQALQDVKLSQEWQDTNAVFKFLNRYGLIKIITDLEDIKDEQPLKHEDVPKVADVIGAK